ncbi:serine/threonine-protein phosphatase 2A activator [Iris pallida]|uniref:Serine/threonine-protein phosphatase 2A activator n=1 Tax=Iris pallida TaxID=29817 RepID=A0AAX6HKG6_IRIPA|nr:serine/threonine-protein phosphatase 2A activator [Iris pallida]
MLYFLHWVSFHDKYWMFCYCLIFMSSSLLLSL